MLFLVFSISILLLQVGLILTVFIFLLVNLYTCIVRVPPISTNEKIFEDVRKSLALTHTSYLCDLGCGRGKVLAYLIGCTKGARGYGCELSIPFAFLAKYTTRKLPITISIASFHSDTVKKELERVTHVYCYLMPTVLDALLPVLEKHLQKGTRVVSCDYQFSKKEVFKHIVLTDQIRIGRSLFVYKF